MAMFPQFIPHITPAAPRMLKCFLNLICGSLEAGAVTCRILRHRAEGLVCSPTSLPHPPSLDYDFMPGPAVHRPSSRGPQEETHGTAGSRPSPSSASPKHINSTRAVWDLSQSEWHVHPHPHHPKRSPNAASCKVQGIVCVHQGHTFQRECNTRALELLNAARM